MAQGPQQPPYVLDCAALGINDLDSKENARVLIIFWNTLGNPRNAIVLRNASERLCSSLRTKHLDTIFQFE